MRKESCWMRVALLVGLVAGLPGVAWAEVDGCGEGGSGSQDIASLEASFDEGTEHITVVLTLCANADSKTKYRVHFDHTAPFATDCDRNGDTICDPDGDDFCVTTSDDTMMHRGRKDRGPGQILVAANVLTYWVSMAELNLDLQVGDTIFVWADTQSKGIQDRAPDTDDADGCAKPEVAGEFVELMLQD